MTRVRVQEDKEKQRLIGLHKDFEQFIDVGQSSDEGEDGDDDDIEDFNMADEESKR